jgi:hypothetical protein
MTAWNGKYNGLRAVMPHFKVLLQYLQKLERGKPQKTPISIGVPQMGYEVGYLLNMSQTYYHIIYIM